MSDLTVRTIAGIVLIFLALGTAILGGYTFAVFVAAAAVVMFWEWRRIVAGWGVAWQIGGFIYALVPALALLWLRDRSGADGLYLILWVFIVTWATDIGAYIAGRAIGGAKLAPTISPNKTIAGLVGGLVSAGLAGAAWTEYTLLPTVLIWLAPPFAVAAQAGDLFESWMKRKAGIKDSGNWLPGHGGALDRLDGLVVVSVLTAGAQLAGWL